MAIVRVNPAGGEAYTNVWAAMTARVGTTWADDLIIDGLGGGSTADASLEGNQARESSIGNMNGYKIVINGFGTYRLQLNTFFRNRGDGTQTNDVGATRIEFNKIDFYTTITTTAIWFIYSTYNSYTTIRNCKYTVPAGFIGRYCYSTHLNGNYGQTIIEDCSLRSVSGSAGFAAGLSSGLPCRVISRRNSFGNFGAAISTPDGANTSLSIVDTAFIGNTSDFNQAQVTASQVSYCAMTTAYGSNSVSVPDWTTVFTNPATGDYTLLVTDTLLTDAGSTGNNIGADQGAPATYSITYDGNTNTGGSVPVDSSTYATGASATVLTNSGSLVKTGYTFNGWNTAANGSGTPYATGSTLIMGSANITLYAQWTLVSTFNITYNGNTNNSGSVPTDSTNYSSGATVTVASNTGTLAKTGYTFNGWNTAANGSGTARAVGSTFAITANVTLYAQWVLVTYDITYTLNGGTNSGSNPNTYNVTTATITFANPTRAGYTFTGWSIASIAQGSTGNVTTVASWTLTPTYTVTYNGNGNTSGTVPTDGTAYATGATVTVLTNSGSLVSGSYPFLKWNTQANGLGTDRAPGATFAMGSANITLYAIYDEGIYRTIDYAVNDAVGGSIVGTAHQVVLDGGNCTAVSVTVNSGYMFLGWKNGDDTQNTSRTDTNITYSRTITAMIGAIDTISSGSATFGTGGRYLDLVHACKSIATTATGNITLTALSNTESYTRPDIGNAGRDFANYSVDVNLNGFELLGTGSRQHFYVINALRMPLVKFHDGIVRTSTSTGYAYIGAYPQLSHTIFEVYNLGLIVEGSAAAHPFYLYGGNHDSQPPENTSLKFKYYNSYVAWLSSGLGTELFETAYNTPQLTLQVENIVVHSPETLVRFRALGALTPEAGIPSVKDSAFLNLRDFDYENYGQTQSNVMTTDSTGTTGKTGVTALAQYVSLDPANENYLLPVKNSIADISGSLPVLSTTDMTGRTWEAPYSIGPRQRDRSLEWDYLVTYDQRSATVPSSPTSAHVIGPDTTVASLPTAPTRTGYSFNGWFTGIGGTGVQFLANTTVSENTTVYAYWIVDSHNVMFNSNGGSGSIANQAIDYGTAENLTVNSFTRTGYSFANWNTAANGSGTTYADQASFTMGVANITLYAQWTVNTYYVLFDANTGVGSMSNQGINYGASANLTANTFTKTGFTFAGWNTLANGTGTAYNNQSSFTMSGTSNVTLYAQWQEIPISSFMVTYDQQGATVSSDPTSAIVNDGETVVTLPTAPTKTGNTFGGWWTQINGGGTQFLANTVVTTDITAYAKWTLNQYTLTFDSDGGSSVQTITQNYGSSITPPTAPIKSGYSLSAWSPLIPATMPAANATHTAQWALVNYAITYVLSGGTNNPANPANYNIEDAEIVFAAPTRTGYTFVSWSVPSIAAGSVGVVSTTATWEIIPTTNYDVTVQSYGNSTVSPAGVNSVVSGGNLSILNTPAAGYQHSAWSATGGLTIENPLAASTRVIGVTGDGTVTASVVILGVYSTISDLKKYMEPEIIRQLTDDNNTGEIDQKIVYDCIEQADNLIDAFMRGRYPVDMDFADVPGLISDISTKLAAYHLYRRKLQLTLPEAISKDYKFCVNMLKEIQAGTISPWESSVEPTIIITNKTASDKQYSPTLWGTY